MFQNSQQNPLHKYTYQIPGQEKTYQITTDQQQQKKQKKKNVVYNNGINGGGRGGNFIEQNNNKDLNQQFDQQIKLDDFICVRCNDGFLPSETVVNSGGQFWHAECFVCAQCFQPFQDGIYFEFEGRKYCEHDFHVLYSPCCNEFIIGRVIKAMNANWHPQCFTCELCNKQLADVGFLRNAGRKEGLGSIPLAYQQFFLKLALCRECNELEKAAGQGKYVCHKCRSIIEDGRHIKFRGDSFHPYHFNCKRCDVELTDDAREIGGALYCLRCHDLVINLFLMGIPICGACHRPVEERVVTALGKQWHVEHFVCAVCEKPFLGHKHYERKGLAYCEQHFHLLYGHICFKCGNPCGGEVFQALGKTWCVKCFSCSLCDKKMDQKTKFFEFDMKPVCKKCYEKFPTELKKRISDNLKEREADTLRRRSASPSITQQQQQYNNKNKTSKSPEIK
ncbi:hypothetical protein Mgra_00005654 [Meloidogyne graminicola]|uniref:LIM zinc-binding domain-containing protein n=1 Tax=Meloidogyne graminicola TaxID=189291 RepID=A0A8S9ZNX1_9BILA|nr:hypothetical protein Mgra_00005654 [Meloidogyne graminicola]